MRRSFYTKMLFEKYNIMVCLGLTKYIRNTCADGIRLDYRGQGRDPAVAVLLWTTGSRRKHGGSTKRISCVWLIMLQCDFIIFITSYKLYYCI